MFTPLYGFAGGSDGEYPIAGVVFGPDGNLYGTTAQGGIQDCEYGMLTCGTGFNLRPAAAACKTALCI
ncbi:MAG: hypothetical protein ACLP3R_02455 [Candidatus Korobacteraceae bacterium]